jgi:hypothetical protein
MSLSLALSQLGKERVVCKAKQRRYQEKMTKTLNGYTTLHFNARAQQWETRRGNVFFFHLSGEKGKKRGRKQISGGGAKLLRSWARSIGRWVRII